MPRTTSARSHHPAGSATARRAAAPFLRTVNNRDGRPYEEKTIVNYVGPGKNLDACRLL
jgi:hypothetical protein